MNYKIVISTLLALSAIGCTRTPSGGSGLSSALQSPQTIQHFQVQDSLATDTRSGLMWMRCLSGTTWNGYACVGSPTLYGWQQLQIVTKTMNYAGYNDWRVPTLEELKTLADSETGTPAIKIPHLNQLVFPTPDCLGIEEGIVNSTGRACWQWTSTPIEGSDYYAWIVYFGYGYGSANYATDTFALRLVRNNR